VPHLGLIIVRSNSRAEQAAVDGGDGSASAKLNKADEKLVMQAAARTASDPESDPVTGADLGAGPGAGTMTKTRK
jgi:Mn-containing catalase